MINKFLHLGRLALVFASAVAVGSLAQAVSLVELSYAGSTSHKDSQKIEVQGDTQYLSYYFGRVPLNSRQSVSYTLSNLSDKSDVKIERITIGGMFYSADTNCPDILKPGQKCLTSIAYWPSFEGSHHGELVWYTSDGIIVLSLWGDAYRL